MSKGKRRLDLAQFLDSQIESINESFQMMEASAPAPSTLERVDWSQVTKLGDELSKQATVAGMLWGGEAPDAKALKENMSTYFNVLQGFILICCGTTVGAGPTLHKCIHSSAKRVVDCSLSFFREAVSSYESPKRSSLPKLTGEVWEACTALKKAPSTNYTAIGRAMTQVAVYVKDILREMKELIAHVDSPGDSADRTSNEALDTHSPGDSTDRTSNEALDTTCGSEHDEDDNLSRDEITIVQLVISVASNTLAVIKEVIRFVTGLLKCSGHEIRTQDIVDSLERLLSFCQEMADQVNDLGACVYPPQDVSQMKSMIKIMYGVIRGMCREVECLGGSPEAVFGAFEGFESSLKELESGLGDDDLVNELEKLSV
ncbi:uncharacterized protein [Typha angustifolia]|uniref:uncharacterized protein isoform X1 n=2 Tax=Typha angustifolia TaxID=59011 RepID=UPI003C2DBE01